MESPPRSSNHGTLAHVMAVPGVGARIFGAVPLLERCRLRSTCCAFFSAVDESLEGLSQLNWEDIDDVASRPGGLDWLLRKCPNLHTLSFWPRGGHKMHRWDLKSFLSNALKAVAMPSQSLLGLGYCRRLRSLNLAGCKDVDDITLAVMASSCRELEVLDVSHCSVTDESIIVVANYCPRLLELGASARRSVTDASLKQLAQCCRRLQRLTVDCTEVTDAGIIAIARRCTDLRLLDVSHCLGVTDASLMMLAEWCPALEYLGVCELQGVTDAGIIAVAKACSTLRGLDVNCSEVGTDAGIRAVADHCNQLEYLDLKFVRITASALMEVVRKCPRLRHLDMGSGPSNMDDQIILELAARCKGLRHLSLSYCPDVTDAGIVALGGECHQLESLHVGNCERVTDVGIAAIAQGCPRLRRLELWGCDGITDAGMSLVGEHCPDLEELTISSRNGGVTEVSMSVIGRNCARLRAFNISESGFDEPAFRAIAMQCTHLEELDISGNDFPLHVCMAAIAQNCTRLRGLRARNSSMTDEDVALMLQGPVATQLVHLEFSGYTPITDQALMAIAQKCLHLRLLDLECSFCFPRTVNVTDLGVMAIGACCRQLTFLDLTGTQVTRAVLDSFDQSHCDVVFDDTDDDNGDEDF
eukprot:jgi/Mesvir1/29624/Mv21476-RA.1